MDSSSKLHLKKDGIEEERLKDSSWGKGTYFFPSFRVISLNLEATIPILIHMRFS